MTTILDKAKKILYRLYKDNVKVNCTYSLTQDDDCSSKGTIAEIIKKDLNELRLLARMGSFNKIVVVFEDKIVKEVEFK